MVSCRRGPKPDRLIQPGPWRTLGERRDERAQVVGLLDRALDDPAEGGQVGPNRPKEPNGRRVLAQEETEERVGGIARRLRDHLEAGRSEWAGVSQRKRPITRRADAPRVGARSPARRSEAGSSSRPAAPPTMRPTARARRRQARPSCVGCEGACGLRQTNGTRRQISQAARPVGSDVHQWPGRTIGGRHGLCARLGEVEPARRVAVRQRTRPGEELADLRALWRRQSRAERRRRHERRAVKGGWLEDRVDEGLEDVCVKLKVVGKGSMSVRGRQALVIEREGGLTSLSPILPP
jgi:hypothetical protein